MLPTNCKNFRLIALKLRPSRAKMRKNFRGIKKLCFGCFYIHFWFVSVHFETNLLFLLFQCTFLVCFGSFWNKTVFFKILSFLKKKHKEFLVYSRKSWCPKLEEKPKKTEVISYRQSSEGYQNKKVNFLKFIQADFTK